MRILIIAFLIQFCLTGYSQDIFTEPQFKKNSIFLEIGSRSIASINYERILFEQNKWKVSARIGIGFTEFPTYYQQDYFNIPVGLNVLYGKGKSYLEIGITLNNQITKIYNYSNGNRTSDGISIDIDKFYSGLSIGYRHQRPQGGICYAVGIKPVLNFTYNKSNNYDNTGFNPINLFYIFLPFGSLGYSF